MTCKDYLDNCIKVYYSNFFTQRNFKLLEGKHNNSFAVSVYSNDFYFIKITCDRQLIEAEISSIHNKSKFIHINDLSIFIELLNSKDQKPSS